MNKFDFKWFDLKYFSIEELLQYEWVHKPFLYLMPLVPFLFLLSWLLFLRFRPKLDIIVPQSKSLRDFSIYLRFIPTIFFLLFIELVLVALARPQKVNEIISKSSEGIDIVVVMDISESMAALDFVPNRLEAAKKVAIEFVDGRQNDRIGMVVFSGEAFTLCPLTSDYNMLKELIADVKFEMIDVDGTAIGTAIAAGTNRMRELKSKSKVMILLSDGESNAGQLDPITAAQLANGFGIKIYTIAVGKDGEVDYKDENGDIYSVNNQLNEETLKRIAEIGQGKFERATNNEALSKIFRQIDKLEKSKTKVSKFKDTIDYYDIYLMWSLVFFLTWLALKSSFMSNVLVD